MVFSPLVRASHWQSICRSCFEIVSITLCTCNSDMNRKVCRKVLTVAECQAVWADSWASRDVKWPNWPSPWHPHGWRDVTWPSRKFRGYPYGYYQLELLCEVASPNRIFLNPSDVASSSILINRLKLQDVATTCEASWWILSICCFLINLLKLYAAGAANGMGR